MLPLGFTTVRIISCYAITPKLWMSESKARVKGAVGGDDGIGGT
jgi:hypothetical protein